MDEFKQDIDRLEAWTQELMRRKAALDLQSRQLSIYSQYLAQESRRIVEKAQQIRAKLGAARGWTNSDQNG
jgi:hypothetical protein